MPCSGPFHCPRPISSSAARAATSALSAVTVMNALSFGSSASMRPRQARVSSGGETSRARTSSEAPARLKSSRCPLLSDRRSSASRGLRATSPPTAPSAADRVKPRRDQRMHRDATACRAPLLNLASFPVSPRREESPGQQPHSRRVSDRARAAAVARGSWPVRVYRLGVEPPDDLGGTTTPEERLAMMEPLSREAFALSGRRLPTYRRAQSPVTLRRLGE